MIDANVTPNLITINSYISILKMKGNDAEAQRYVEEEMQQFNLKPDATTFEILAMSNDNVNQIRLQTLEQYWKQGGDDAVDSAWNLFHILIENKAGK